MLNRIAKSTNLTKRTQDSIKKNKRIIKRRRAAGTLELTMLALPSILFVFVFNYVPLYGLILPFKNYNIGLGLLKSPWAGLENFEFLLTSDVLWTITRNTVFMNALFFTFNTIFSVTLALLLFELTKKFVKFYQTVFFFPYFMSWVIVSYIVAGFLESERGVLNKFLEIFGIAEIQWYNDPKYWPFILVTVYVWKMAGYGAVIYYAGLIGIDREYYESSLIDGASKLQQVRYISIPLITPLIIVVNLMAIGRIFYGDFGLFYNVPKDIPFLYPATDVIDTYVYRALRQLGDIGMSSAAGLYQSVCGFILIFFTNLVVKKINPDNALF
ncbi:MAG TPA: sugar ABC transporter permease [Clostridiaceae bacterium]|nr:sugar ABC transporter permease [Clostridiaceae bacterium]